MRGSGQSGGDCIAWQPIDYMGQCLCVCVCETERTRVRERVDEWEVREKKGGIAVSGGGPVGRAAVHRTKSFQYEEEGEIIKRG